VGWVRPKRGCLLTLAILRIPQMIWVWRATVEWYWQGKTEELGEKPVPVPLCPPQIPHGLTRARTRDSAVRGRRLTTWVMARNIAQLFLRDMCPHRNLHLNILDASSTSGSALVQCCWLHNHKRPNIDSPKQVSVGLLVLLWLLVPKASILLEEYCYIYEVSLDTRQ
jgi:hypothetical protein